ncbi:MAG TPA: 3-methyl-2-oxobutanoate hydroxymethyltransferase [Tepidisphaeraceae bacterium]|jgi:3-methyl-2-oxobutanoate hydroxymethyltransferase
MPQPLTRKISLTDLRSARTSGSKIAMLTCYDYTTATLMQRAGVPALLVGDSAANVILGHDSTLPVSLDFMIAITAAVRRGAPLAFLVGDMPFGSYQASTEQGVLNVFRMVKESGCDCVKLEVADAHAGLITRLADAGVAVMAHIGLRPQAVGVLGGYRFQGRTADEAEEVVKLAEQMQAAGASAILLEAVPPEVAKAVVERVTLPVIGCGAGPDCDGHVVVTHDMLGLTPRAPRFVPRIADMAPPLLAAFAAYAESVASGQYPQPVHAYEMPAEEKLKFAHRMKS